MAQFRLEQELQAVLHLNDTINIGKSNISMCDTPGRSRNSRSNSSFLNASRNASTSRLLSSVSSGLSANNAAPSKQRSHSASRATPSKGGSSSTLLTSNIINTSRSTSPSRNMMNTSYGRSAGNIRGQGCAAGGDRFIPNRSNMDMEMAHHALLQSENSGNALAGRHCQVVGGSGNTSDQENEEEGMTTTERQRRTQTANILLNRTAQSRILSFQTKAPAADEAHVNSMKGFYSASKPKADPAANMRHVSSRAEKILDAPDLVDDFYLHLLDWSVNNHLAVALVNSLYVWNASDGSISELFSRESESDIITSVAWIREGNILGVGDSNGDVQVWDVTQSKLVRTMRGHTDRIPVLGWNEFILASGCRSGQTWLHDVRIANHHVTTFAGHTQEVCGMAWSPDHGRILATGSNDNLVHLWDPKMPSAPVTTLNGHMAAIKAISWCPWQPKTLATGGGTTDRTIKFWNTSNGNLLQSVDTGSQVSSIVWNEEYKELVSGHGFSHNQIMCWKYPSMTKVADLRGHTSRVLLLLKSPDGSTVASAAADETIRVWNVWPIKEKKTDSKKSKDPVSLFSQHLIR